MLTVLHYGEELQDRVPREPNVPGPPSGRIPLTHPAAETFRFEYEVGDQRLIFHVRFMFRRAPALAVLLLQVRPILRRARELHAQMADDDRHAVTDPCVVPDAVRDLGVSSVGLNPSLPSNRSRRAAPRAWDTLPYLPVARAIRVSSSRGSWRGRVSRRDCTACVAAPP